MRDMTHDEIVDEALSKFDFAKVHNAMLAVGWSWLGEGVPTIEELKSEAERLMRGLLAGPENVRSTECGGLFVRKYRDGDYKCEALELRFVMESYTVNRFPIQESI